MIARHLLWELLKCLFAQFSPSPPSLPLSSLPLSHSPPPAWPHFTTLFIPVTLEALRFFSVAMVRSRHMSTPQLEVPAPSLSTPLLLVSFYMPLLPLFGNVFPVTTV